MRRPWLTAWVLLAAVALLAACETSGDGIEPAADSGLGDQDIVDIAGDDVPVADTGGSHPDVLSDTVADVPVASTISGCVSCHTDKERLIALAPEEPVEEEESGGG